MTNSTCPRLTSNLALVTLWLLLGLTLVLTGCGSLTGGLSVQERIREYLYKYQPTTGQQFVTWADANLSEYSPEQVYTVLYAEGEYQAQAGHPNVVGVLSFSAQAWAREKGFHYEPSRWLSMQQEAKSRMRAEPGKLQLWPEK